MVDHLSRPLFLASLREHRTHRPTTNLHRRLLDDFNHSFEWNPGVLSFVTNPQMTNSFEVQTIMPSPNESQRVVRAPAQNQDQKNQEMKSTYDDTSKQTETEGDFAALIGLDWG